MNGSFSGFVHLFHALDATTSVNRKVAQIATFLRRVDPRDAAWAVTVLSGRSRRRFLSARRLREIALPLTGLPQWLFDESYAHVGDTAETIALLCGGASSVKTAPAEEEAHRVGPTGPEALWQWMEELAPKLAAAGDAEARESLARLWSASGERRILVINKLFTGALRLGVSEGTVVRAVAQAHGIEPSVVARRITAWGRPGKRWNAADAYRALVAEGESDLDAGAAYPFYLASPVEDPGLLTPLEEWLFEWKWDGIRLQALQRGGTVTLWTRGGEVVNASFPELAAVIRWLPEGTVLDGELLACTSHGDTAPFSFLQKRLGRKKPSRRTISEYPVKFTAYDVLEYRGEDLRGRGLVQRREILEEIAAEVATARTGVDASEAEIAAVVDLSPEVAIKDLNELERLRQGARDRGVEGLMAKRRDSPYRQGRVRGEWWKYKADPFTLDAVLVYARAGSGRRANLFTDYTFALRGDEDLVTFARAYSGLSDREISRLDRWIRQHTTERFGPARAVEPELVFEIAFEGIAPSGRHKSGLAVRFPRILRWREDKSPAEANTVEDAWRLSRQIHG